MLIGSTVYAEGNLNLVEFNYASRNKIETTDALFDSGDFEGLRLAINNLNENIYIVDNKVDEVEEKNKESLNIIAESVRAHTGKLNDSQLLQADVDVESTATAIADKLNSLTNSLPLPESKAVTPGTSKLTVTPSLGKYLQKVEVAGDSDLVASNIKSGVNLFGVTGTYTAAPAKDKYIDALVLYSDGECYNGLTFPTANGFYTSGTIGYEFNRNNDGNWHSQKNYSDNTYDLTNYDLLIGIADTSLDGDARRTLGVDNDTSSTWKDDGAGDAYYGLKGLIAGSRQSGNTYVVDISGLSGQHHIVIGAASKNQSGTRGLRFKKIYMLKNV